jgi:LMBR1 domain-containing protein 1
MEGDGLGSQTVKEVTVEYEVSFPIYCMAFLSFVGWFLFAIFGGVGLSALPIDLIRDFMYRPRMRSSAEAR